MTGGPSRGLFRLRLSLPEGVDGRMVGATQWRPLASHLAPTLLAWLFARLRISEAPISLRQ